MTALPLALSISSTFTKIGAVAAFASLLGIALLSLLVFSQARELKRLREWAGRAPERAADLEQRVSAAAASRIQQGQPPLAQAVRPAVPRVAPAAATAAGPATRVVGAPAAVVPAGQALSADGTPIAPAPAVPLPAPDQPAQPAAPAPAAPLATPPVPGVDAPAGAPAPAPATPAAPPPAVPVGAPASAAAAAAQGLPVAQGTTAEVADPRPPAPATAAAAAAAGVPPPPGPRAPAPPRPAAPARPDEQTQPAAARRPPAPAPAAAARRADARAPILAEARRSNYVADPPPRRKALLIVVGLVVLAAVVAVVALTALGGSSSKKPKIASVGTVTTSHNATTSTKAHKPAAKHEAPAVSPAETTLAVLNATESEGLAHRTAIQLQQSGYSQATALGGKPPGSGQVSVVEYVSGHKAEAEAVAHSAEVTQVQPIESAVAALANSANVVLIVGADKATQSP